MMKLIAALVLAISLTSASDQLLLAEDPSKIAMVKYSEVGDQLIDLVLAEPLHAALKESYLARRKQQKEQGAELMKQIDSRKGNLSLPTKDVSKVIEGMEIDKQVSQLAKAKLVARLREQFGNRYDIILNATSEILYAEVPVVDLTQQVKQRLMLGDLQPSS